jgi:hypothetical protein
MSQAYVDNTAACRRNPDLYGAPFPTLPLVALGVPLEVAQPL